MRSRRSKIAILVLLLLAVSVGYAFLSTTLKIKGTAKVKGTTWNVYFDNIDVKEGSVVADEPELSENDTKVVFEAQLKEPGDYYEFTVDAVNEGSIDAMIESVTKTSLTEAQAKYVNLTIAYEDGVEIQAKDLLASTKTEKILVSLEYKKNLSEEDLPISDDPIDVSLEIEYVQADDTAKEVQRDPLIAFINEAKAGNATAGDLGREFEINMGTTYGVHKVRVANVSSPSDFCDNADNSQTACGVVLEFADVITTHNMNPDGVYQGTQYNSGWNKDGYPKSQLYKFLNNDIYYAIPKNIRDLMLETRVVSGYGREDANGTGPDGTWVSNDKLYLLSAHELFTTVNSDEDKDYNYTRQLDYYESSCTTAMCSIAVKKNGETPSNWWLRSPLSLSVDYFFYVHPGGGTGYGSADSAYGISPAFRIN